MAPRPTAPPRTDQHDSVCGADCPANAASQSKAGNPTDCVMDMLPPESERKSPLTKAQRRAVREAALAVKQAALPTKHYGVIVADPEWRSPRNVFGTVGTAEPSARAAFRSFLVHWDDQYPLHHRAIDQSLREGKNSPQNRPQFGLKRLNRQNIFGFERPRGRRDTLYCSPFFDSISHPIGQDPMILCINAQAASSGDLAQGFR